MSYYMDYLEAGFRIMSILPVTDGLCGCMNPDCKALFKHPRAKNWQNTPHWSDEQLENMIKYDRLKQAYGVLVDDHLVIDVDPRNGGTEGYKKLCEDTGLDYEKESGFVVQTGGGGLHIYFNRQREDALSGKLKDYPGVDFKSSGFVIGSESMHASGCAYETIKGSPYELNDAPGELVELLKKVFPNKISLPDGGYMGLSTEDLIDMLSYIKTGDATYEEWTQVGMAIHDATGGANIELWEAWSEENYKGKHSATMHYRWSGFGKHDNPLTQGYLKALAQKFGYITPVTFNNDCFDHVPEGTEHVVDLCRPPGLVGTVADWINKQSRYPREHLAVAAALVTVGNVAGMRHKDVDCGANANMFAFCVAGSGTGKEAILQSVTEIMTDVGLSQALVGKIKSEQEVVRNLLEHQAAFYNIDEMGYELKKVSKASGVGGATYLDGVPATLMSIYSKSNGMLTVSGDVKREESDKLSNQIARVRKKADTQGEDCTEIVEGLTARMIALETGIKNPFLSLLGFTTPVTFNDLMNYEQGVNGFFARSVVVQERDVNPRPNKSYDKTDLPDDIRSALTHLYAGGYYDPQNTRVEKKGDFQEIKTEQDAIDRLDEVLEYFLNEAEKAKEISLEPIPRRGYELVLKVSLILAFGEGVRTLEHVEWANAFVVNDMREKMNLVASNMAEEENRGGEALARKLVNYLTKKDGETTAVICNRLRLKRSSDVKKTLETLRDNGIITSKKTTTGIDKWFLS